MDFRKAHDGLAAVVQNELGLDPYSGVAFVFRAKCALPQANRHYAARPQDALDAVLTPAQP